MLFRFVLGLVLVVASCARPPLDSSPTYYLCESNVSAVETGFDPPGDRLFVRIRLAPESHVEFEEFSRRNHKKFVRLVSGENEVTKAMFISEISDGIVKTYPGPEADGMLKILRELADAPCGPAV